MKLGSFKELFICLLSDIYDVENQIVTNLPKVIKQVHAEELKTALQDHLVETKNQVKRLEKIFQLAGERPMKIEWSRDIKNLFADGERFMKEQPSSPLLDAAIIVMMQRVEHFEIATYGCLQEFAEVLENPEIKNLLHESLKEEHKADSALTKLAKGGLFSKGINAEATHNL